MSKTDGLWEDVVDPKTGRHSLTEGIKPKLINTYCKKDDHYFEPVSKGSRTLICTDCGLLTKYIVGKHRLENGKLVKVSPK